MIPSWLRILSPIPCFLSIVLDICLGHWSSQCTLMNYDDSIIIHNLLKLFADVLLYSFSASCGWFAYAMQKEKVSHSYVFRCCFRFVLYWRTQILMTLWCLRLLTCTRLIGANTRQLQGAGPRSMQWVNVLPCVW
jgi:hypothetical protein